jgi:KaiC/GvpD/RAD55 family RecA-like ATPase
LRRKEKVDRKLRIDFTEAKFSNYLIDSVVKLLIEDSDFAKKVKNLIKPKVFLTEERIALVRAIYRYIEEFDRAPGEYVFDIIEDKFERDREKKELLFAYLDKLVDIDCNKDYVLERFGGYVKQKLCQDAIERAHQSVLKGQIEYAEATVLGGFRDAYALTTEGLIDYLSYYAMDSGNMGVVEEEVNFKTLIDVYDKKYGGLWKKEMLLIFGDYNIGKSFFVVQLGRSALVQGKKVLHVTLETSKEIIWERYCMCFTGKLSRRGLRGEDDEENLRKKIMMGDREVKVRPYRMGELRKKLDFLRRRKGKLWLYQGMGFKFSDLKNLLDNIEVLNGQVPDVVIIDSPDQMLTGQNDVEFRMREKSLYKKLLDLTKERNITMIVTTQARRGSRKKKLTRGEDIAEGYDKIRIVDTAITINQSEEEYKRQIVRLYIDRCRGGKKGCMIEGDQMFDVGQFIFNDREIEIKDVFREKIIMDGIKDAKINTVIDEKDKDGGEGVRKGAVKMW